MRKVFSLAVVFAMACAVAARGSDPRADELIKQAREALGGEAKLKAIRSLSASGKFRRVIPDVDRQIEGEVEIDFLLPDKYVKTETTSRLAGGSATRVDGFNGDKLLRDFRSSGGGMIMMRTGGDTPEAQAAQLAALRGEFARQLLAWLLVAPETFPLEFSYAGEAESEDGRADVLDVKAPAGFAARLFLDQKSHRPLMLGYRAVAPRMVVNMSGGRPATQEERDKLLKDAQKRAEAQAAEAKESEMMVYFSDYREVDGILLPHQITRSVDGETSEEMQVSKFKINPPLKPERFQK
jgi:hypothetical protein